MSAAVERLRAHWRSPWASSVRDLVLIVAGAFVFAVGLDCFQVPNGLAPGGASGLATVIRAWVLGLGGPELPVGAQTLAMNALLMIVVVRTGGLSYAWRSVVGIVVLSVWTDVLSPVAPHLSSDDLLLAALWGGVITGAGLGLVFRAGGNTGGTDILAQLLNRKTGIPVGTGDVIIGTIIVALSAMVFSLENALYAYVSMFVAGKVIDVVVDGPRTERVAWIISQHVEELSKAILVDLNRGCTKVEATGQWTKEPRPMLFVILGRSDVSRLKAIVAERDPDAIVVISEAHEAFGEGFKSLSNG